MSKLYFTYSAMNAGKSTLLLQAAYNYRERGMQVMLWTASHYGAEPDADSGEISSRIGLTAQAHLYRATTDIYRAIAAHHADEAIDAVFVDEAQFLTQDQVWQLAEIGDGLQIPVLCYGLRTDFQGQLFEGSAALLAIADNLKEAKTLCHCGRKATMTARLDQDGNVVTAGAQVGIAKEVYVSLCRKHWKEAVDKGSATLL
ncbi:MAG: thymidine kinase [Henriciella sp.]|nr:thymidine kinase [Henriciella sp.]